MKKKEWIDIWHLWKDIWKFEKKSLIFCILAAILKNVRIYIPIILLGNIVDLIYAGKNFHEIMKYIVMMAVVEFIAQCLCNFCYENYNKKLENPKEFCAKPYNIKALNMDYEHLEDTHVQEVRFRAFSKSFYGVAGWFLYTLYNLLETSISIVTAIVIVFPVFQNQNYESNYFISSHWFTLILFVVLFYTTYLNYREGIISAQNNKKILDSYDYQYNKKHYYQDLFANVEHQKDIRIGMFRKSLEKDVDNLCKELTECQNKIAKNVLRWKMIEQLLTKLSSALIYIYIGLRAYIGMITIGSVTSYTASIVRFMQCGSRFANTMGHIKSVAQYAADYYEFMNLEKRKYEGTIPVEKRRDNRFQIDFEHVSFKYPGSGDYVIKDLNLSFVIGEKMAIVGRNGSGKTTFIKLLCRLYDVTEGCIKLNGIDIRKYDYNEYCKLMAVVFQDFRIFAFSIGDNIAASEYVDKEKAVDALSKAGLRDRLLELENGLDTYVDKELKENGVNFSGGEKQKIAIARAIYKDAAFVIMDEPTAALDPESECEVFAGFDKMVGNKTALYISHRLASCRFCEDILVFDAGKVVQRGAHEKLVAIDGLYKELWNAQAMHYNN